MLTEFRPFGLTAEALDGGSPSRDDNDDYHYFLFDPRVAKQQDEATEVEDASSSDHELFVRGNRCRLNFWLHIMFSEFYGNVGLCL